MRKKFFVTAILAFIPLASLFGKTLSSSVAAWSQANWDSVDSEIEAIFQMRSASGNTDGNINVAVGDCVEVPVTTLKKLAGRDATLALQIGGGTAISASGRDLRTVEQNLKITVIAEEDLIPDDISSRVLQDVLYSRMFAMEEKTVYENKLNIHFSLGREYAGKYANLYHFDELSDNMVYDNTFVITGGGMAMFSLWRGDEYILTVTDELPAGGRFGYTVMAGDSLFRIASHNGTSVKALLEANPGIEDADNIYVGQVIAIVK